MNDKNEKQFDFIKLLENSLKKMAEKGFNYTAQLNIDLVKKLTHSEVFLNDVNLLRTEFKIPKLNKEDIENRGIGKEIISVSLWFEKNIANNKEMIDRYEQMIDQLYNKYKLPFNFKDWLQSYILYYKSLGIPKYPLMYGLDFIYSEHLQSDIRLTTQEKRFFTSVFRESLKIPKTGRIPKQFMPVFQELKDYLNKPENKNTKRRLKNFDLGLWIFNHHGKKELYLEEEIKFKYIDLAGQIYKNAHDDSVEADLKRAGNLRKKKQKFLEQTEFKNK